MPKVNITEFLLSKGQSYSDWFGTGNTREDFEEIVKRNGLPLELWTQKEGTMGVMILLIYHDKIIVKGYDGNEYCHTFEF